jgi:hypothetical protein
MCWKHSQLYRVRDYHWQPAQKQSLTQHQVSSSFRPVSSPAHQHLTLHGNNNIITRAQHDALPSSLSLSAGSSNGYLNTAAMPVNCCSCSPVTCRPENMCTNAVVMLIGAPGAHAYLQHHWYDIQRQTPRIVASSQHWQLETVCANVTE